MLQKIAVVGAGNVGATAAQRLAEKNLARRVVMIDVVEGVPQGKGLDQWESAPIEGFDTRVIGTNGYDEAAGRRGVHRDRGHRAEAGDEPRRPGQDQRRHRGLGGRARSSAWRRSAIIIVVSNPLDVMCYVAMKASRASRASACIGMAGVLDTARYRIVPRRGARRLGGGHPGDGARRPRRHDGPADLLHHGVRHSRHPADRAGQARRDRGPDAQRRRRDRGAASRPGRPTTRRAAAAVQMVEAIALDKKRILPCSAWLTGEYGLKDVFCGVPCKLGRGAGSSRSWRSTLTDAEREGAARVGRGGPRARWSAHRTEHAAARRSAESTVGKKVIMAVTGLVLVGFVMGHMAGNLLVFQGARGAQRLRGASSRAAPLVLWTVRLVLLAAVGAARLGGADR